MTLAMAIEKRLEREIARALEIMGHVRDRAEGLNEADTKAAFIDPILSALGWELRGFSHWISGAGQQVAGARQVT
jgi:hypothetical protein